MSLAIFDLDNTLISGDSDYLWGQYLCEQGIVDAEIYERENQRFYDEYKQGKLDIFEFLRFSLQPLAANHLGDLEKWRAVFVSEKIIPIIPDSSRELINKHRDQGDTLMIITATNRFVTAPIADELGIPNLLATDPEMIDNRYTGEVDGIPCFQDGKVTRLRNWLESSGETLTNSWFYSDSHNDLPLLKLVDHAIAVDPDDILFDHAMENNWPVISLHNEKT